MNHRSQRSAEERHARSQLAQRITGQPFLRGCLVDRARSCGDPSLLAGIPTLARVAAWGGGFPIKVNGEIVGAIGVSGAPAVQNDVDCASAALALVRDALPAD